MEYSEINFNKIHWGAFSNQLNIYNRKNKTNYSLKEFSEYIRNHPENFIIRTRRRATFYLNFVEKK